MSSEEIANNSVHEGRLMKRHYLMNFLKNFPGNQRWQSVFCILYENRIFYYKDEYSHKIIGTIELKNSYDNVCEIAGKNNQCIFAIKNRIPTFEDHIFMAENKIEMKKWIGEIEKQIKNENSLAQPKPAAVKKVEIDEEKQYVNLDFANYDKKETVELYSEEFEKNVIKKGRSVKSKRLNPRVPHINGLNNIKDNQEKENFYWQSIWWDKEDDPNIYLMRLKENGLFLIRKSQTDANKHVLVAYCNLTAKPQIIKYAITEKQQDDGILYSIDDNEFQLSIEELCLYYHKHALPHGEDDVKSFFLTWPLAARLYDSQITYTT